ncbi:MAG: VCBS repeat-containing protein [Proteobacteria bacterium]|nr:VCBS repeat-containing protein [Pseudomonadota bacterium]
MPTFPDCTPENLSACPNDLRGWALLSNVPAGSRDTVRPEELAAGTGLGLDRAVRHTAGRFDVSVAILDSGIDWTSTSLYKKILLNADELPPPQNAAGEVVTDLDGNGVFNLYDYAEDARVDVADGLNRSDDRLDPSDLIAAFSDGVDDDGNGYIDDIAGWDFFGEDNDPYTELQSSAYAHHGTGVMKDAAESGDDGGGIGACPNCAALPLRVGDAIITDGDRVALALAYATDRGVKAAGMAVGSLTHPEAVREAIAYAADHDVVMVGAAGDENSWHPNVPALEDPILFVHTVRADRQNEAGDALTYTNFLNCNNFGPRLDLVAPSTDCATGAVARLSGMAGLLHSAGLDAGTPLTGDEVRALMRTTAFDIALSEADREAANTYPSKPGWDAFYGYGRADAGAAVEAVFAGEIPPTATITSPYWFTWADGTVAVEARITARAGVASWELEVGTGAEPDSWQSVASGSSAVDGHLADVSLAGFGEGSLEDTDEDATITDRFERAHRAMVTLRLTVTDEDGRTSDARRGIWPRTDPDRLDGFPLDLGSSLESAPVLADLDGDGVLEVVLVASGGLVHVIDGSGTERDGFPVSTFEHPRVAEGWAELPAYADGLATPMEGVAGSPAVGDLDGDGLPEVVVAGLSGRVYAWSADGALVDGFPVAIVGREAAEFTRDTSWDHGIAGAPSLGDVDGDGDLEIIAAALDQRVYVWLESGELMDGYPLELCQPVLCGDKGYRILTSPALGDLDGDGDLDAAVGTNELPQGGEGLAYLIDLASASIWEGTPILRDGLINQTVLPVIGEGHPSSIALADVDGDGAPDLVSNAMLGTSDIIDVEGEPVVELNWTASGFGPDTNFDDGSLLSMATQPSFGDLTGDGVPDFAMGGSGPRYLVSLAMSSVMEFQHGVGAWDGVTGEMLPGFPRQVDDISFLVAPTIADITGDGVPEVIYGSGGFLLHAWDGTGQAAPGFPKQSGGWILGGAAIGDIDGDGYLDVVVGTRSGSLHAWTTAGPADVAPEWASTFHDAMNTGNHSTPLPQQLGPELADGCCKKGRAEGAWLLLPFVLVLGRRRRA